MGEDLQKGEERSSKMCLLCCQNPSLNQRSPTSANKRGFTSFFNDGEAEVDLCLSCRNLLTPAVEKHEKAVETEARVVQLQQEILKEMKTLQSQLCQFYVEMEKVREAVGKFPGGVEGQAKASASFILRQKLYAVVRDLQLYNAKLAPKILLCKIDNEPKDHDHESAESEVDVAMEQSETLDTQSLEMDTYIGTSNHFHIYNDHDVNDNQSEEFDADADLEFFELIDMEVKPELLDIGGEMEEELAGVVDEDFSDTGVTKVNIEQCAAAAVAVSVKVKAKKRRGKTKWSKPGKYAKTKKSYPVRKPKPAPKDDEWLPESEISRELIAKRKKSQSLPPKMKIQAIKKTKGLPMPPFKKSVIANIIATKGVTFQNTSLGKKNLSLLEPFKHTPMNYDSSTDTISVGDIPVIIDENEDFLKCSSCTLEFRNSKGKLPAEFQVHEHILGHHLQTLKCPVCDKGMTRIICLTNHLLCHEGHNPCDICGRPFADKRKIVRHKITHMNVSERAEASARGEGRTFESYLYRSKKEKNISNFPEEVTSALKEIMGKEKTSDWKRKIICRVIKEAAKQTDTADKDSPATKSPIIYDQATDKLSVSGIEIFMNETEVCLECSTCSVKIHGRNSMQMVELSMHNHILSKHIDALRCPFPAEQCTSSTRSFETVLKYNQHLRYFHSKEGQEKAVCEICGKIFKSGSILKSHRALHDKPKIRKPRSAMRLNLPLKHKCPICGKGFWSRNQMKRHEVSHLPPEQRNFSICNRCGMKFHSVYHLNRHQKVTCFEKGQELPRVPCQFCSRTLKNNDQLRKHIAKIHPEHNLEDERPFQCSMCPQRFKNEWSMEMHEKMRHSVAEGDVDGGKRNPHGSGYRCGKGCGKLIATAHGRKVHETYCDGEGCKTERERSKSKKK